MASALFRYAGPSFAVLLFPALGAEGVVWLRLTSAAVLLAPWSRPWRVWSEADGRVRRRLLALGACVAAMNTSFYWALARLPVSLVAAVEFTGVVALAASGARTWRNLAAVGGCAAGVYTLVDIRWRADWVGLAWAGLNAALFGAYVLLGHGLSRDGAQAGVQRLGAALTIAAGLLTPFGLVRGGVLLERPALIGAGIGVGLCSSVLPYVCDQFAMARLPRASFALLLALLPVTAAVFGALILRQIPTRTDWIGIGLVMGGLVLHRPR